MLQPLAHIFNADVGFSIVHIMCRVKADPCVGDSHDIAFRLLPGGQGKDAAASLFGDPVLDGVLHQRLDGQHRQEKMVCLNIVNHGQFLTKAQLFQLQVGLDMVKLLMKRDHCLLFDGLQIVSQVGGKLIHHLPGGVRVRPAQIINAVQHIKQEMGLKLAERDGYPAVLQLPFQLLHPSSSPVIGHNAFACRNNMYHAEQAEHSLGTGSMGEDV